MSDVAVTPEAEATDQEPRGGVVIVALPAESDPIHAASSEQPSAHMTLAFLGDISELSGKNVDVDELKTNVMQWAEKIDGPITEGVAGTAVLGADKAQVVLIDASAFAQIVDGMTHETTEHIDGQPDDLVEMENAPVTRAHSQTEQFPVWTPHVTLGYPEAPPTGEFTGDTVTFDRLALWAAGDYFEFPLGGAAPDSAPEDALVAAAAPVVDEQPAAPAPEVDDEGDDDEDSIDQLIEIPFHGVAAPVERPTGDGRIFREAGLTFADKLIMRYAEEDWGAHQGARRVGRITNMWLEDGLVQYQGFFSAGLKDVDTIVAGLADGSLGAVSVDVDDVVLEAPDVRTIEIAEDASDDEVNAALQEAMNPKIKTYAQARVRGITMVDFSAFVEAYVALGDCDCPDEVPDHDEPVDEPDIEITDEDLADFAAELDRLITEDPEVAAFAVQAMKQVDAKTVPTQAIVAAAFAPGTHDGPGWITAPVATSRIRRYWVSGKGAGKIRWGVPGDFNRCRSQLAKYVQNPDWLAGLCANMHKEALGVWPGQEDGGRKGNALVASGAMPPRPSVVVAAGYDDAPVPPRSWFEDPHLTEPTPLTITAEGRVFGHVSAWTDCHIGSTPGVCTAPPRSVTDYAYFHLGLVETDGGDVEVGHITMGTGHAGLRDSSRSALAHYDNTGSVVCDIAVGDDEIGTWFAGALRPGVTDGQRRELKAAKISGDWRDFGNEELDLVAALAVNVPGFARRRRGLAASGGRQTALVAAGMVEADAIVEDRGDRVAFARAAAAQAVRTVRLAAIRRNP